MTTKRKPAGNPKLNWSNLPDSKSDSKGMKPCQEQATITSVLASVVMHVCKSVVFIKTNYRIFAYLIALFVISVLADVLPFPKTPFARRDNFFNVYFVKISWGWTLITTIPFVMCTSMTYCCGDGRKVCRHLLRLAVATFNWYFWTNAFIYFEHYYGKCSFKDPRLNVKTACLMKGHHWQTLDVSGHCFILIYSVLVFIEECCVIVNWDTISDLIRKEEYSRTVEKDEDSIHNPLRNLSANEFDKLKEYYYTFTPYIKFLFFVITILIFIWDFMLLTTILYFHNMLEKLLAGLIAIATWYTTYRILYKALPVSLSPGDGTFKYRDHKMRENGFKTRQPSTKLPPGPKFMGNPLRVREDQPTNTDKP